MNLMKKTLLVLSALFALFAFAFANVNNGETYKLNKHSCTVELKVNGIGEMEAQVTSKGETSAWVVGKDDPVEGGMWQGGPFCAGGDTFEIVDGRMMVMNKYGEYADMGAPRSDKVEGDNDCQGLLPPARS